ncbi:MAG: hypothetical protein JXA77_12115 [Bacteroidales bacterium]|nr:hypothetical protein [Bacteroidales bacterium]MBN2821306.1 hypothetical protein [Bacteroidales bacterium]
MNSTILQISSRYLNIILLIASVFALIRGHNQPGGGFIGGLLASLSVIFNSLAYSPEEILKKLRIKPIQHIALGLILVLLSIIPSLLAHKPVMHGIWIKGSSAFLQSVKIGTPLLFDIGVFFTVIGVTLLFFFSLLIKK